MGIETVGVGLLTFNHKSTGREEDFWRTYESIKDCGADEVVVLTNGSTDGTSDVVRGLGGIVDDTDSRIFYGNTKLIEALSGNDLTILSADDLEYRDGWLERLLGFIEEAPPQFLLFSAYMEPVWQWNQPRRRVTYGGQVGLVRDSVCGSSWAFRSEDWAKIGPFPEQMPGEDLVVCQRLAKMGGKVAALDLADHIGQEHSAWGNESHLHATPLDRERWKLDEPVPDSG